MTETEGIIKYHLEFQPGATVSEDLEELNTWRSILYGLRLIGQDESRYQGYGYGNISIRSRTNPSHFITSGSQTGGLAELEQQHYVTVEACDVEHNKVTARGPVKPSSEALTHAMIYQLAANVQSVLHVHDPVLWGYGLDKQLPQTSLSTEYGTPQMANEIAGLLRNSDLANSGVLVMAGHKDGVVCFGDSVYQAGKRLLKLWVNSWVSHSHLQHSDQLTR